MKSKAMVVALALAGVTVSTQARAQSEQEDQKMCERIAGVRFSIGRFQNLGPNATVKQAQDASDQVQDSVKQLRRASEKARPEQTKQLEDAVKELRDAVKDAPKDATLGQVEANITDKRAQVRQAFQALEGSIRCPGQGRQAAPQSDTPDQVQEQIQEEMP